MGNVGSDGREKLLQTIDEYLSEIDQDRLNDDELERGFRGVLEDD